MKHQELSHNSFRILGYFLSFPLVGSLGQREYPFYRGTWLARLVEHTALGLRVVNSSSMLGVQITLKKNKP